MQEATTLIAQLLYNCSLAYCFLQFLHFKNTFSKISQLLAVACWHLFCLMSQRASKTSSHYLSSMCTEGEYVIWKKWWLCIIFVLGREHTASGQKRESLQSAQQLVWQASLCHSSGSVPLPHSSHHHLLLT